MPAASTSQARSGRSAPARATRAQGKRAVRPGSASAGAARVQWNRLARIAMACVLVALAYLYLSAGIHMLSTWRQARGVNATVAAMEHQNKLLTHQHEAFARKGMLEAEARQMGMMKQGEQPYIVSGLPDN